MGSFETFKIRMESMEKYAIAKMEKMIEDHTYKCRIKNKHMEDEDSIRTMVGMMLEDRLIKLMETYENDVEFSAITSYYKENIPELIYKIHSKLLFDMYSSKFI